MIRATHLLAAVVAVAAVLTPTTASAAPHGVLGIEYESTSDYSWPSFPGRMAHDAYAPCFGDAERLVGIGGSVIESVPPVPDRSTFPVGKAFNVSIRPLDQSVEAPTPDSTWHEAENRFPADPGGLVVIESTVCATGAHDLAYPRTARRTPGRERTTAKVACPGGRSVLSGGVLAKGPFRSQRMVASAPYDSGDPDTEPDDGWRASVDNLRRKKRGMKVFAICSSDRFSYVSARFIANPASRAHVEPACPFGEYVVGGGVKHRIPQRRATIVASRTHTGYPATKWMIELDNLSANAVSGAAYAVCHT